MNQPLRHVVSINDLSNGEIEAIFEAAERYLRDLGHKHRIARSAKTAAGKIVATLFYEPSTRTRLSFESAALRLGAGTISSSDPATSSAAKGESLADTVRVISSYADAVVIRHPRDGAAKLAAEYAEIPVINGGDGSHEHPTQTLCDLFTLTQEKKSLKQLVVEVSGDLKSSRTVHSFVYALARFGATIVPMPSSAEMKLPAHVDWRLRHEFGARQQRYSGDIETVYIPGDTSGRQSICSIAGIGVGGVHHVDILYMTRFQKERWADVRRGDYPRVDKQLLDSSRYRDASILHPLPRVGELATELDEMPGAAYFRQAAYGVPVRMALIAGLLELESAPSMKKFEGGFCKPEYREHVQPAELGLRCPNDNCITHDAHDGKNTQNKYYVVRDDRLRCFYCESDVENLVLGYRGDAAAYFRTPTDIEKAGYGPRKQSHIAAAE